MAELSLKHALRHIPVMVVVASLATVAAGCSDSRMAANNAASTSGQGLNSAQVSNSGQVLNNGQVQQSNYQVGYGLSSEGPTTDLYTELKGSWRSADRPQAAGPVQQATSAGVNGQQVADSGPGVVQQPAGPPREQPTTTAYGIPSDGPTTDVYTALFGPRTH